MIVTITSLVPKYARKKPAIPAYNPPATTPTTIVNGVRTIRGKSGNCRANVMAASHPAKN